MNFKDQLIQQIISKFTENPEEFVEILYSRFQVKGQELEWHKEKVIEYFETKLIPHKTEVFKAGIEISKTDWFERLDIDKDEFVRNLYLHDLSKFSLIESVPYALHDFRSSTFSDEMKYAWCHHKAINPHHPEHWLNPMRDGELKPLPMKDIFIAEMVADWIGAGKCYGEPFEIWVPKNIDTFKFHLETKEKLQTILKEMECSK